ncbi:hypothetical protein BGW80DRAFT_1171021 [Lactifluus volemus]|nr:hypothetical protein BGW80DRAFT_1171021 [Lactifluus volemus]
MKTIVDEVTTLRHHLDAHHSGKYHNWAKGAKFISKLPSNVRRWKAAAEEVMRTLDRDLKERQPLERVVPYSAQAFRRLSIEWLVATDQPIQSFQHPMFIAMLNMASRATNGLHIPGRKVTWTELMNTFRNHLVKLKAIFAVSC